MGGLSEGVVCGKVSIAARYCGMVRREMYLSYSWDSITVAGY